MKYDLHSSNASNSYDGVSGSWVDPYRQRKPRTNSFCTYPGQNGFSPRPYRRQFWRRTDWYSVQRRSSRAGRWAITLAHPYFRQAVRLHIDSSSCWNCVLDFLLLRNSFFWQRRPTSRMVSALPRSPPSTSLEVYWPINEYNTAACRRTHFNANKLYLQQDVGRMVGGPLAKVGSQITPNFVIDMLDSIATLFSAPSLVRNYQPQPSLRKHAQTVLALPPACQTLIDHELPDLIDSLSRPIETWIIQKEPHLYSLAFNEAVWKILISHNHRIKEPSSPISPHNLFVLIVQYRVLNERIKQMGSTELQLAIDGACGAYLREEKSALDELNCLLHFMVSHCRLHEDHPKHPKTPARAINLDRIPNFFKIYSDLPSSMEKTFIDTVVNVVPLLAELLKVISKTDASPNRSRILQELPWVHSIGCQLFDLICSDIDKLLEEAEIPSEGLRGRLKEKNKLLAEVEGFVSPKALFEFAYRELYYFQHSLKLHRQMMELSLGGDNAADQQKHSLKLVGQVLAAACTYDLNLPDTAFQLLSGILGLALQQETSIEQLFPQIVSPSVILFTKTLKNLKKYNWPPGESTGEAQFYLEGEGGLLQSLLQMVYSLKLQYLELIGVVGGRSGLHGQQLQFYLLKNGLLHFLLEELSSVQSNDRRALDNYFKTLSLLLRGNRWAYTILDEVLRRQMEEKGKCQFAEYVRKNFFHAKPFLMTSLADALAFNPPASASRRWLPLSLSQLLYDKPEGNHDIWVSYIHDVIVRELKVKSDRGQDVGAQLNEWVSLAIMLQAEYVGAGGQMRLGQFTMSYLSNALTEAIKWKHADETEVMRRLSRTYEEWEVYYTQTILDREDNIDIIEQQWGPAVTFVTLRRWNRQISRSIQLFIDSVVNSRGQLDQF